jgi:hypothetical protein
MIYASIEITIYIHTHPYIDASCSSWLPNAKMKIKESIQLAGVSPLLRNCQHTLVYSHGGNLERRFPISIDRTSQNLVHSCQWGICMLYRIFQKLLARHLQEDTSYINVFLVVGYHNNRQFLDQINNQPSFGRWGSFDCFPVNNCLNSSLYSTYKSKLPY